MMFSTTTRGQHGGLLSFFLILFVGCCTMENSPGGMVLGFSPPPPPPPPGTTTTHVQKLQLYLQSKRSTPIPTPTIATKPNGRCCSSRNSRLSSSSSAATESSLFTKRKIDTIPVTTSLGEDLSSSDSDSDAYSDSIMNTMQQRTMIPKQQLGPIASTFTKIGMISFILGMCITLPMTLLPQKICYKLGLISKLQQEQYALRTGCFCARWLFRIIPFCNVNVQTDAYNNKTNDDGTEPEPTVWVCNHSSALDVFVLLANDKKLRGKKKRPIKIIYWKQLEDNPVTKLLFQQCGFIPVQMAANKPGEQNDYDIQSFKNMLKLSKQAFQDGFDIGILPEGQLNPTPEKGLLPVFPGAYTLARMSKRPIQMLALHGVYQLWHPDESIGMNVTGRNIKIRAYPPPRNGQRFTSADEFVTTFEAVIGEFATHGHDLPEDELQQWLNGSKWKSIQKNEKKGKEKKKT